MRTLFVLLFAPGWIYLQRYFNEIFLLVRRTKRFWKTNLKSVCRPLMQVMESSSIRLDYIFLHAGAVLSSKTKSTRGDSGQLRVRPGSQ